MQHRNFFILLLIIAAVPVSGCDAIIMDYIPTPAQIAASHGTFLVSPKAVTGHYANMDVDSAVFSYTTAAPDATAFWQSMKDATESASWTCTAKEDNECHFERMIPKAGQQMFNSAEQVRVSYDSINNRVVVAWVQADSTETVAHFSQTGESTFAESAVWPQFRALTGSKNGLPKR